MQRTCFTRGQRLLYALSALQRDIHAVASTKGCSESLILASRGSF